MHARTHTHTPTHTYVLKYTYARIIYGSLHSQFARATLCMDAIIGKHFAIREKTTFQPLARLAERTTPSCMNSRKSTERCARAALRRDKLRNDVLCSEYLRVSPREGKYGPCPRDFANYESAMRQRHIGRFGSFYEDRRIPRRNCQK